jgi:hypothetical protein
VNISSLIPAAIAVLMVGAVAFGLTMSVRACLRYHGKLHGLAHGRRLVQGQVLCLLPEALL